MSTEMVEVQGFCMAAGQSVPLLAPAIRLVSMTQPVEELRRDGIESAMDLIAFCARVSNPKNQMNSATASKLIKFLINRSEWSPLEQVDMAFEIETARDITRQILRHRSFTPQEFSQRYAEVVNFCVREARLQDEKDRQNSIESVPVELYDWWIAKQVEILELVIPVYREALKRGIAKECARVILPEGLTMSRLYFKGSIRSWIHYLKLRCDKATQKEHRMIALEIAKAIVKLFPIDEVVGGVQ